PRLTRRPIRIRHIRGCSNTENRCEAVPLTEVPWIDPVVEDHGPTDETTTHFADEFGRQCRTEGRNAGERYTLLVSSFLSAENIPRARSDRTRRGNVHAIRPAYIRLIVINELDVMFACDVVIKTARVETPIVAALALEIEVVAVVVGVGGNTAFQSRRVRR